MRPRIKRFSRIVLTRRFEAVPVPAELLFHVVRDVGAYQRFVPMCNRSRVLFERGRDDFDAELRINYRLFEEAYQSRVVCGMEATPAAVFWVRSIATTGGVVQYLESLWRIQAQNATRCSVDYAVSFEFSSIIYNTVTHLLKDAIAARISSAMLEEALRRQQQMGTDALAKLVLQVRAQYDVRQPAQRPEGEVQPPSVISEVKVKHPEQLPGVDPFGMDATHLQYIAGKRRKKPE